MDSLRAGAGLRFRSASNPGPRTARVSYRACLVQELGNSGLRFCSEFEIPTTYKGLRLPGVYRADLIVEEAVIVELKTVEKLLPIHSAQLLTYLRLSGARVGLLLNFKLGTAEARYTPSGLVTRIRFACATPVFPVCLWLL